MTLGAAPATSGSGAAGGGAGELSGARLSGYYLASFAALGAFLPYWPRWLSSRGVDGPALGVVAAVVPAVAVVAPLVAGRVADALGLRGALLRLASGVAFGAFALIAAAGAGPLADGAGAAELAFLVGVTGLFALARSPMILVADVLALEARGGAAAYGARRRFGSVGFLVAAVAVSLTVPLDHAFAVPAVVAACLGAALAASFGLPLRAPPLPSPDRAGAVAFLRRPGVPSLLLASMLLFSAHAAYDVVFSLHLRDLGLPDRWVGLAWAIGVAAEIALFSRPGRILAAIGHEGLLVVAALGGAARWVAVALAPSALVALALQPLHAVSFGCLWLGATGLVARRAPEGLLASSQGTLSACNAVGHAAGMFAWPVVFSRAGGGAVFAGAAAVAALSALPAISAARAARATR